MYQINKESNDIVKLEECLFKDFGSRLGESTKADKLINMYRKSGFCIYIEKRIKLATI
jgi:hypothetical protein